MKCHVYIKVAVMLLCITVLSLTLTVFTAVRSPLSSQNDAAASDGTVRVVTSFYPVYIAALNVAGGIDGVQVVNMVDGQAGCLHDYQMSPADRVTLENADIFVMNGAGAEPFLTAALHALPDLRVVDLSSGQTLLASGHVHSHDHGHEHDESDGVNSHLWVSPLRYRQQIETLREALVAADPAHAAQYRQNAAAYLTKIEAVWTRLQAAATVFADTKVLLFHDSLGYLAEDLDLSVAAALHVGEDSGLSAADLKQAEDALTGLDRAIFIYDSQYDTVQYAYLQSIPRRTVALSVDTGVTGVSDADAWLRAMTALCESLEAAA